MNLSETISGTTQKIGDFATKHQTSIEVGLSWGLFGASVLAAWFSAPKAKEEIALKKAQLKVDTLPTKEKVLIIGKYAIRVALPFAAACVVNNDAVSHVEKNLVATTAMAEMWRNHAIEYQEATKRVVGEKKEQKIRDDMEAADIAKNPPVTNVNVYAPKEDGTYKTLFKESAHKRYFWARRELVEMAIANTYKLQDAYDEVSMYDFYMQLPKDAQEDLLKGLDDDDISELMDEGWNRLAPSDGFHADIVSPIGAVPSGEYAGYPYLVIQYDQLPFRDFR